MDIDPPRWWHVLKIKFLWSLPREPRKKIKALMRLGDECIQRGDEQLAGYCYDLSKKLAQDAGTVHLLKKINQRLQ